MIGKLAGLKVEPRLSPKIDQFEIRGLWLSLPIVFRILLLFSRSCLLPLICCTEQSQEGHGREELGSPGSGLGRWRSERGEAVGGADGN